MQLIISPACATPPANAFTQALVESLNADPAIYTNPTVYGWRWSKANPLSALMTGVTVVGAEEANVLSEEGSLYDVLIPAAPINQSVAQALGFYHVPNETDPFKELYVLPSKVGAAITITRARNEVATGNANEDAAQFPQAKATILNHLDDGSGGVSVQFNLIDITGTTTFSETHVLTRIAQVVTPKHFRGAFVGSGAIEDPRVTKMTGGTFTQVQKDRHYAIWGAATVLVPRSEIMAEVQEISSTDEYATNDDNRFSNSVLDSGPEFLALMEAAADHFTFELDGERFFRSIRPVMVHFNVEGDNTTPTTGNGIKWGYLPYSPTAWGYLSYGSGIMAQTGLVVVKFPDEPAMYFPTQPWDYDDQLGMHPTLTDWFWPQSPDWTITDPVNVIEPGGDLLNEVADVSKFTGIDTFDISWTDATGAPFNQTFNYEDIDAHINLVESGGGDITAMVQTELGEPQYRDQGKLQKDPFNRSFASVYEAHAANPSVFTFDPNDGVAAFLDWLDFKFREKRADTGTEVVNSYI